MDDAQKAIVCEIVDDRMVVVVVRLGRGGASASGAGGNGFCRVTVL